MNKQIVILLLSIFTVISCTSNKKIKGVDNMNNETANILTESVWELSILGGKSIYPLNDLAQKIHFSLNSSNNSVAGYSGCNNFNGSYSLEKGNRIKFTRIASTRMACPDAKINESKVLQVFNDTDNYTIANGMLSLNIGRRAPLAVFRKALLDNPILEKYWKLVKLDGKTVTMSADQEREMYFMLKADQNRVTGFAGCNNMTGTYLLEKGNRIKFSKMAGTLMLCPDLDFKEADFFEVFELADNYTLHGDKLTLNVGKRAPLAEFEAVYF